MFGGEKTGNYSNLTDITYFWKFMLFLSGICVCERDLTVLQELFSVNQTMKNDACDLAQVQGLHFPIRIGS